jgi:hypothetical protein
LGGVDIHTLENSPLLLTFHTWWEFLASKNITESDNIAHNGSKFIMTKIKKTCTFRVHSILFFMWANSMQKSWFWEADSHSTVENISWLSWSVKSHHEEYCLLECCPM